MQIFNPYLPANEYIPDGEPRVFGDRLYVYGSHDRFGAGIFCVNDYVCWSTPVNDLSAWRCEGVIFRKKQDPANITGLRLLFAPDVVQGSDGRYYLYYAYDFMGMMGVAVSDRPEGPFAYHGHVRYPDGTVWGNRKGDEFPFDPGVLVDDDGRVYLYSGFATKVPFIMSRFHNQKNSGGVVMELEQDMLTIKAGPKLLFPRKGNNPPKDFDDHEFFEASSIRKIDGKYVFVYSSAHNHELCYAVSDHPMEGFRFGGTLVDDFTTVNESLLSHMISRATGLKQPESASVEDRTIDAEYLALIDAQYTYRSYMDQGYEPWYVNEDGIPATWTQDAVREEGEIAAISIQEMTGVDFELDIVDGAVVQGDDEGSKKWEAFMNQLTWEEMASLVDNGGGTQAISAVGVAKVGASETPLQLSGGTMWACPPILAASFNLDLAEQVGVMMGNEALFKNCSYWQGNALNIHRSPLSGRNVEYSSQDGVHSGMFSAAVLKGITSKGVTCFIKHMMLNDQESYRDLNGGVFTWATEQVIREIYAKPFEYSLKQGGSTGIMGSFNRIGNINAQLNLAMKNLVRVEWDNRAIFETDAWQGTYCPVDLMVRQGNNQVLGSGEAIPAVGLEYGQWDAEGNCVRVSDGGDATFLSQTHYAAVRKSAQEILWNFSNGNGIKNGYSALAACVLEFDSYAKQSLAIAYEGVDFQQLALAAGSEMPAGFTLDAGVIASDGTVKEGEWTINVDLTGIDGYISLAAPVVIKVVDPIHVSETELRVGQAAEIEINAPYYTYNNSVTVNEIYVNTITDADGNSVQGQWYPGGGRGKEGTAKSTGDSIGGSWRILNWYWKDAAQLPAGNTYDCVGHLAFADIEATDARYIDTADVLSGNYYKAFLYEFRISDEDTAKLAEYGLSVEKVMTNHTGYQGINYDVNTGLKVTGAPTKAGEVTVTITVQIPLVVGSRFPNFYARMSPVVTEVTRTVTLTIGK